MAIFGLATVLSRSEVMCGQEKLRAKWNITSFKLETQLNLGGDADPVKKV